LNRGLGIDQSIGLNWLNAIHADDREADDREATQKAWDDARARGEYYVEHRIRRHRDGEYLWHQTRAKPLEGSSLNSDWVGTMTDIDDLRGLQSCQQVLMAELQHRTRNLLSVVQAIANQTLRSSDTLESFKPQFASRLRAVSRVQGLLSQVEDHVVDLKDLVAAELAAHGDADVPSNKIQVYGPTVALSATAAQALGLALHELATNAVKYGALAQSDGKLEVRWEVKGKETNPGGHFKMARDRDFDRRITEAKGLRSRAYRASFALPPERTDARFQPGRSALRHCGAGYGGAQVWLMLVFQGLVGFLL
jgi:two-component sensor histidine kinase